MFAAKSRLRALWRAIRLAIESISLYCVFTLGRAVLLAAPATSRRRWRSLLYGTWARRMTALFGIEVRVEGAPPRGAFLLAANHLSYVDIPVIAQTVDAVFISKAEIRRWPVIGTLAASVGTIFVDRKSGRDALRVTSEMQMALRAGRGVVLFPEGTSSDGTEVLPFKSTLLQLAASEGLPVYSATLRYETRRADAPPSRFVCWVGDENFVLHMWRLLGLPRIFATIRFGPPRSGGNRKDLARQLQQDVKDGLKPSELTGSNPPS